MSHLKSHFRLCHKRVYNNYCYAHFNPAHVVYFDRLIQYTANNEAIVEIYKQDQKYYGKLISLKEPNDANGKPRKDNKNKVEKLQTRNLVGILIFWNMVYSSENNRWENGKIYDPHMGHEAKGVITVIDKNTIKLIGYVGFEWISKSQIWKRKAKYDK